jgi:hypothetical protein
MKISFFLASILLLLTLSCHSSKKAISDAIEVEVAPPEAPKPSEKPVNPNDPKTKSEDPTTYDCFDKTAAQPHVICDEDNRSVCGCNNVNYKNACEATKAGVKYYSWGKCPKTTKTGSK